MHVEIANPRVAGKTSRYSGAHAQPVIVRICQEAHCVSNHWQLVLSWVRIKMGIMWSQYRHYILVNKQHIARFLEIHRNGYTRHTIPYFASDHRMGSNIYPGILCLHLRKICIYICMYIYMYAIILTILQIYKDNIKTERFCNIEQCIIMAFWSMWRSKYVWISVWQFEWKYGRPVPAAICFIWISNQNVVEFGNKVCYPILTWTTVQVPYHP